MFRPLFRAGLRVADGLGQHLAQLSLGLRGCPRDRCLPVSHDPYVGMPEAELKPTGDLNREQQPLTVGRMGWALCETHQHCNR